LVELEVWSGEPLWVCAQVGETANKVKIPTTIAQCVSE